MSVTVETNTALNSAQVALHVIQTVLGMTEYHYSKRCTPANDSIYDHIIVGGGSAGMILANRISENPNITALVLEAGAYPPFESDLPAAFPLLPKSTYDFNYTSIEDPRIFQNLKNGVLTLTQGKMLGGSGGNNHLFHCQGDAASYNGWAEKTGDSNWNYTNALKYLKKTEDVVDTNLLKSSYGAYHGDAGYLKVTKQYSEDMQKYLDSYKELGYAVRDDVSGESALGFAHPLLTMYDGYRTSGGLSFASPLKTRSNVCLSLDSTVNKVIIVDGVAKGVQFIDSNGDLYEVYAKHEVLIAAGAINSVGVLIRSGIGPKDQITNLGIPLQADLPVGECLQDHPCAVAMIKMEESDASAESPNMHEYPSSATIGYIAHNASAEAAEAQIISLLFPHDSTSQIPLTSRVFGYTDEICDKFYAASTGRNMYLFVMHLSNPKSCGSVEITSLDPFAAPEIRPNYYSEEDDITVLAQNFLDFIQILNTTNFREVNASLVDLGGCTGDIFSLDYWKCYVVAYSTSMRHYTSTNAMTKVVNSDLTVKGIENLRVVDSSALPSIPIGEPKASVHVVAERAAELVLEKYASKNV